MSQLKGSILVALLLLLSSVLKQTRILNMNFKDNISDFIYNTKYKTFSVIYKIRNKIKKITLPKDHIRVFTLFDAPVYLGVEVIAVSILLFLFWINTPITAVLTISSYVGIIFIHELGHAIMAKKYGYSITKIYIGLSHGYCSYTGVNNKKNISIIAWGGVIAQLFIAVPVIILISIMNIDYFPLNILGLLNLVIAVANILPVEGRDGYVAWDIFLEHPKK